MRSPLLPSFLFLLFVPFLRAEPEFPLTADSKPQDVPQGALIKDSYTAKEGSVFPGTQRDYQIYLPAGHDASKPAAFMVFQDGVIYQAPVVFDNLIAKKDIPPLVGIFIKPGIVPAANENALPRFNRSCEYDSITPTYSQFLIDEFLPAIEAKHGLKLSTDPNLAAISGNSSGGICAFMVAWHRPNGFRRVFTGVGTYVGIHGADQLPVLVRKFEPKPLRVFLQSGTGDNNLYCGDWWMANQMMERSLTWAGYDVNHAWGEGGHNQKHASQIFPDVLRWLWRDWQTDIEVKANPKGESKWRGYEVVGDGEWINTNPSDKPLASAPIEYLAASLEGTVWATSTRPMSGYNGCEPRIKHADHTNWRSSGLVVCPADSPGALIKIPLGQVPLIVKLLKGDDAFFGAAVSRNGELFMSIQEKLSPEESNALVSISSNNEWKINSQNYQLQRSSICISDNDVLYSTDLEMSQIRAYSLTNLKEITDESSEETAPTFLPGLSRISLSPDQSLLFATTFQSHFIYSGRIGSKSTIENWQPYTELQPDHNDIVNASGMCSDTNGWLYVATSLGIQVCDQAGRVNFIIPTPKPALDVCFGGKDLSELFIACGDTIYKRPTKAKGVVSGQQPPIKPAPPKL